MLNHSRYGARAKLFSTKVIQGPSQSLLWVREAQNAGALPPICLPKTVNYFQGESSPNAYFKRKLTLNMKIYPLDNTKSNISRFISAFRVMVMSKMLCKNSGGLHSVGQKQVYRSEYVKDCVLVLLLIHCCIIFRTNDSKPNVAHPVGYIHIHIYNMPYSFLPPLPSTCPSSLGKYYHLMYHIIYLFIIIALSVCPILNVIFTRTESLSVLFPRTQNMPKIATQYIFLKSMSEKSQILTLC